MSIRKFLQPALSPRRHLTAAGPAPMRLFSIPMRSSSLPNTWEQHERAYDQSLQGRHAVHLGYGEIEQHPIEKIRSRTRQTI